MKAIYNLAVWSNKKNLSAHFNKAVELPDHWPNIGNTFDLFVNESWYQEMTVASASWVESGIQGPHMYISFESIDDNNETTDREVPDYIESVIKDFETDPSWYRIA